MLKVLEWLLRPLARWRRQAPEPTDLERAAALIRAVDAGGIPLNPARVNDIARRLGLEVSRHARVEDTIARVRNALQRQDRPSH
jgi:hypothetical protein